MHWVYFLCGRRHRYTFTYTRDYAALTIADVATMGAPACAAEYEVLRDDVAKVNHQSYEIELPVDLDLLIAVGHLHAGSNNITLSINGELFCTSTPVYVGPPLSSRDSFALFTIFAVRPP